VTLRVERSYRVRQDIFLGLPWEAVDAHFDAITGAAYSVSLFTDWGPGGISQAWLKRRVPPTSSPPTTSGFFGAPLASEQVNPVPGMDASCCTTQGEAGAWSDRLSHFRADEQPSGHGDELQSEYFVARADAVSALRVLRSLHAELSPVLLVSEIRSVAKDDWWLSPHFGRDSIGLHFTWKHDQAALVGRVLPLLEAALAPFQARPHWGKLFLTTPAALDDLYPHMDDYRVVARIADPDCKFVNPWQQRLIFG